MNKHWHSLQLGPQGNTDLTIEPVAALICTISLVLIVVGAACTKSDPAKLNKIGLWFDIETPAVTPTTATPATVPADFEDNTGWTTINDFNLLHGKWVHHEKGEAVQEVVIEGGVTIQFAQEKDSRTPWNLKFWAPKQGHMTHDTISGGCGFYTEPHGFLDPDPNEPTQYYTAFCKGYGIQGPKGVEYQLVLEMNKDGLLRVTIGNLLLQATVRKQ